MFTDETPSLAEALSWLDDATVATLAVKGRDTRPEHVVWTLLTQEVGRMRDGRLVSDTKRARWVLTWLRYLRYRGASTLGVRQAVIAVAAGARAKAIAGMIGRPETFDRYRLREFRARMAALIIEGLERDFGIVPAPSGPGFTIGSSLTNPPGSAIQDAIARSASAV